MIIPFSPISKVFLATRSLLGVLLFLSVPIYPGLFLTQSFFLLNRSRKNWVLTIYETHPVGNLVDKFKTIKLGKTASPRITAYINRRYHKEMEQTSWFSKNKWNKQTNKQTKKKKQKKNINDILIKRWVTQKKGVIVLIMCPSYLILVTWPHPISFTAKDCEEEKK